MLRRFLVLVLAASCVVAFQAPSLGDSYRVRAAGSAGAWEWKPSFRHIVKGDRVVWKNPTSSRHTVKAYSQNWKKNSELEAEGGRTSKRFRKRGTYLYRCTQPGHSSVSSGACEGMCGEIHVARR